MFKNPFSFDGRILRAEYVITVAVYYSCYFFLYTYSINNGDIFLMGLLPLAWLMLSQGAKRCHDIGKSGWWQFIPFYFIWLLFADGQPHTNEYGNDPKGRGDLVEQLLAEKEETHAPLS